MSKFFERGKNNRSCSIKKNDAIREIEKNRENETFLFFSESFEFQSSFLISVSRSDSSPSSNFFGRKVTFFEESENLSTFGTDERCRGWLKMTRLKLL